MHVHRQRRRWVGSHARRTMAITGGAVAAAALASAPAAVAGTAAPCEVANPCLINTGWMISPTHNPEYPVRGAAGHLKWKYLTVANPGTENVRLSTFANLTDYTGHSTLIEAGVVQGTLGGTFYATPTYFWSEDSGSGTTYHPLTGGPAANTSYKGRVYNADGDACWRLDLGPHTVPSVCVPGATATTVSFLGSGQVLAVDDLGYKAQTKIEGQFLADNAGNWAQWPNGPYAPSPYKAPTVGISPVTGHECYTQPSGMNGTTYMAAIYNSSFSSTPTTQCSAAGW